MSKFLMLRKFWHRVVLPFDWIKITQVSGRLSFYCSHLSKAKWDHSFLIPTTYVFQYRRPCIFQSKIYILFLKLHSGSRHTRSLCSKDAKIDNDVALTFCLYFLDLAVFPTPLYPHLLSSPKLLIQFRANHGIWTKSGSPPVL